VVETSEFDADCHPHSATRTPTGGKWFSHALTVCLAKLWIGVEKGPLWRGDRRPKGTPLLKGFTLALGVAGGHGWDAGCGDDREDPSAA
jgi:hypothetical protein